MSAEANGAASSPASTSCENCDASRLALLMQYTIFHIGAYITLAVAALAVRSGERQDLLLVPVTLFLVAGMCESVVGSNIPRFDSYHVFIDSRIGVGGRPHLAARRWLAVGHTSFWCGLLVAGAVVGSQ